MMNPRRRFFSALSALWLMPQGERAAPAARPACETKIVVGSGKAVTVVLSNMDLRQLAEILDEGLIPAAQRGGLKVLLAEASALTVTFTSKGCPP